MAGAYGIGTLHDWLRVAHGGDRVVRDRRPAG